MAGQTTRPPGLVRSPTWAGSRAVRADRAAAAHRYFASHAEVWDNIRSLHVAESEVETSDRPRVCAIVRSVGWSMSERAPGA